MMEKKMKKNNDSRNSLQYIYVKMSDNHRNGGFSIVANLCPYAR